MPRDTHRHRVLLPMLLLLVTGALAGACQAPLEPRSKREQADAAASSPAPTAATTDSPSARPRADRSPKASAPTAPPKITVPELPRTARSAGPVLGGDVSWPQCPKGMGIPQKRSQGSPMPLPEARFVVVGLTNGPGFTPNPCLADQVAWVRSRHLLGAAYAVVSWPDAATVQRYAGSGPFEKGTRLGALSNVGYQQARFNLASMKAAGLPSPIVWLDVEPVPDFAWSTDTAANAAVVRGAARGYTDAGVAIGAYSTPSLWQEIVGSFRLGVPEWRAAGQTSRAEALRRCGAATTFQGGKGVLGQWVEDGRDQNVTCPGTSADLRRWFHQF